MRTLACQAFSLPDTDMGFQNIYRLVIGDRDRQNKKDTMRKTFEYKWSLAPNRSTINEHAEFSFIIINSKCFGMQSMANPH